MKVELLHYTPLKVAIQAIRTCHESFARSDNGGPKDRELVLRVGNKMKHSSTLEHLTYNFWIDGISRALLQELARHRIASLSVKSTRYTLKELESETSFVYGNKKERTHVEKYVVFTGNTHVDSSITDALETTRNLKAQGVPNDIAKFSLPDAYKTKLVWSINARSLQNFLTLRTSPAAMWEIRKLAYEIYSQLPEDHKFIFEEFIHEQESQ